MHFLALGQLFIIVSVSVAHSPPSFETCACLLNDDLTGIVKLVRQINSDESSVVVTLPILNGPEEWKVWHKKLLMFYR